MGLRVAGIDLDVVDDVLVDGVSLRRGHSRYPITAGYLSLGGDRRVATHAYPKDFDSLQARAGALLGGGTAEEHVIEDDAGASPGHGRYAGHPGGLKLAEAPIDGDLAVLPEGDARI